MALTTTKQRRAIGERLAQERRRLNYTELQIAQLLGVQLEVYLQYESGEDDPGIFSMQRLYSIGFDVMFIITGDRYRPVQEESELLNRFRELSLRGKTSVFMTLDALERLAPNLKENIKKKNATLYGKSQSSLRKTAVQREKTPVVRRFLLLCVFGQFRFGVCSISSLSFGFGSGVASSKPCFFSSCDTPAAACAAD